MSAAPTDTKLEKAIAISKSLTVTRVTETLKLMITQCERVESCGQVTGTEMDVEKLYTNIDILILGLIATSDVANALREYIKVINFK